MCLLTPPLNKLTFILGSVICIAAFCSADVYAGTGTFRNGKFNFCVSVRFNANETQLAAIRQRFERANQFLSDATDGQHQFGTITIVNNSGASDEAEFWIHPGPGRANAGRYAIRRSHTNLFFLSNFTTTLDRNALTIVHEFGHQAYELGDEYYTKIVNGDEIAARCPGPDVDDPNLSYCIMDDITRGTRRTSNIFSVTEFCVAGNHDKPDAQGRGANDTSQHLTHGESCWETMSHLLRPWRLNLPNGLPQDAAAAAQPINFAPTCASQIQRTVLLVDRSGSMLDTGGRLDGTRLAIAQRSVGAFIDQYNMGDVAGIFVGLVSFSTFPRVDFTISEVNNGTVRNGLKTAANSLAAGGMTNIGEGLLVALDQLDAQGACTDCQKTILLISDGDHNAGVPPESVIAELQKSGIKVVAVALGNTISVSGEAALKNLATQTSGAYFRAPTIYQLQSFMTTFAFDFGGYLPGVQIPLVVETGVRQELPAFVESGSTHAAFGVVTADPADGVTLSLIKPSGAVISEAGAAGIEFVAGSNVRTFRVTAPEAGTWRIVINAGTIRTGDLNGFAHIRHDGVDFNAWVENEGMTFSPESVRLHASPAYGGRRVVGSGVTGTVTRPDGSKVPITLFDDGLAEHGDADGGDGIYSALFNQYSKDGTYIFDLTSQNVNGRLYEGEPLRNEDGVVETFPVVAAPAFTRVTSTTAVVAGLSEGDMVWVDDGVPQGATTQGEWYWVDANPAPILGGASHQAKISAPYDGVAPLNEHSFTGATSKLPVGVGDKLFAYVFLDPNQAPLEIMLSWHAADGWEHRAYWGANVLPAGTDGTNSRRFMGPLPDTGRWVRLEVPASAVGLEGKTLDGMAFTIDRNRATWDRAGRTRGQAPEPSPSPGDFVWFDDAVPAGAVLEVQDDVWDWTSALPSPWSGVKCHRSVLNSGTAAGKFRSHGFSRAQTPMKVDPGDVLYVYAYLDPDYRPDEIVVQWNDGDGWEHRAYWGNNFVNIGVHGTESRRFMGGLPPAAQWVRLEVPASYVGLEGKSVYGMAFGYYKQNDRARVSWDVTGKTAQPQTVPFPLQSVVPLYRFRADAYGYSYSTNDIGRAEQVLQRVQGYVHANRAAGTVPFYRFRNKVDQRYFYGVSTVLPDPTWMFDGVAFYTYLNEDPPPGTTAFHQFFGRFSGSKEGYFYSTDQNEGFALNLGYQGRAGYIHSSNMLTPVAPSRVNLNIPAAPPKTPPVPASGTISWQDNSGNETGFAVERFMGSPAVWTEVAAVGANVTSFTGSAITCGSYRVRAFNGYGSSVSRSVMYVEWAGSCQIPDFQGMNFAPSVTMVSPSEGATFKAGHVVRLSADVFDANGNGTVSKVEFFENGIKIGEDAAAPYSINWSATPAGAHALTATATDEDNLAATSAPVNVTVQPVAAGDLLISEFRFRGRVSNLDEFVELYNNTDSAITISTADGSNGWSLVGSNGVVIFTVPNGTLIPPRGNFLGVNSSAYSLDAYAKGDAVWQSDIADSAGIALFKTSNPSNFTIENRLDAAGFSAVADARFREGVGLQPGGGVTTNSEFSFFRRINGTVTPRDTNDNAADFLFVSTDAVTSGGVRAVLGAPGPECLSSPALRTSLPVTILDPAVAASQPPNRVRDLTPDPANNATYGTLSLRRTVTNNSGLPVTRLRFRVADITTLPAASGTIDMRLLNSPTIQVTRTDGSVVTVQGTTLEMPPAQPNGGGFNSTVNVGTVTLAQPLQPGDTVHLQFLLGLQQQTGSFRFYINVEAWL